MRYCDDDNYNYADNNDNSYGHDDNGTVPLPTTGPDELIDRAIQLSGRTDWSRKQVEDALTECGGEVDAAIEYLKATTGEEEEVVLAEDKGKHSYFIGREREEKMYMYTHAMLPSLILMSARILCVCMCVFKSDTTLSTNANSDQAQSCALGHPQAQEGAEEEEEEKKDKTSSPEAVVELAASLQERLAVDSEANSGIRS